jgi:hypothetical protein
MNGQTGVTRFVNQTEMTSLSSLSMQVLWFIGSLAFTAVGAWCLTRRAPWVDFSQVQDAAQMMLAVQAFSLNTTEANAIRQVGIAVFGGLIFAWTGRGVTNLLGHKNVRESSREALEGQAKIVEAEARGKASAHPAVQAQTIERVEVNDHTAGHQAPLTSTATEEPQWGTKAPTEGIL